MASARVVSKHNEHRMRRFKQRRRRSALGAPRRCPGGTALRTPLRTVLLFPSPLPPVFISLKASQCSARGIHGRGNGYWLNYKRVAVHAPKSRAHARRLCGTKRKMQLSCFLLCSCCCVCFVVASSSFACPSSLGVFSLLDNRKIYGY
jgi:hypothetical protein